MPLPDDTLAPLLDELARLEDLSEEMRDLGVTSLEDIERRMVELNRQVDDAANE